MVNANKILAIGSNPLTQDIPAGYVIGFWLPISVPDNYKIVGVAGIEVSVQPGLEGYIVLVGFSYSNDKKSLLISVKSLATSSTISTTITAYGICATK